MVRGLKNSFSVIATNVSGTGKSDDRDTDVLFIAAEIFSLILSL